MLVSVCVYICDLFAAVLDMLALQRSRKIKALTFCNVCPFGLCYGIVNPPPPPPIFRSNNFSNWFSSLLATLEFPCICVFECFCVFHLINITFLLTSTISA